MMMRFLQRLQWVGVLAVWLGAARADGAGPVAAVAAASNATGSAAALSAEADPAAALFLMKCSGCHTIAGPKLTGPSLAHVRDWKPADLLPAIKRMEKNVGLLPDAEVAQLADFLQSATADNRLQAERARAVARLMAKLEPASAAAGGRLFTGAQPLHNGGPACVACHQAGQRGGLLGPRLADSLARMGEMSFISFVENASSPVMNTVYKRHVVTKQEALHLAAYVKAPPLEPAEPPVGLYGAVGAVLVLLGMVAFAREQRGSTRQRLIGDATRSRDT